MLATVVGGGLQPLTWQGGSTHAPCCCCSQPAAEVGAVVGVAAVHWADEAGSCAVNVAVHHGAPGAPQRAVPVAVAGWWRALEAGVSQINGGGFRLIRGRELPQMSGNIAHSGGQVLGQRRTLLREGTADTHGGHRVIWGTSGGVHELKLYGTLKRFSKNRCCQP